MSIDEIVKIEKSVMLSICTILAYLAISSLIVTAIFILASKIEERFFPSIAGTPIFLDARDGNMHVAFYGRRIRDCELTDITVYVLVAKTWTRGEIKFKNVDTEEYVPLGALRPRTSPLWDLYQIKPIGSKIRATAVEHCHPFWMSTTNFFNLDVEESKKARRLLPSTQ